MVTNVSLQLPHASTWMYAPIGMFVSMHTYAFACTHTLCYNPHLKEIAAEEEPLPLSEPRMFTVDNYFLKVHIFCIFTFMINVVSVVLCVYTCIFLQDMYKC